MVINVTKGKQLTNMRTHSADDAAVLTPPRLLSLEECLEFVNDDECVEVTPKSLRLRKIVLDENDRRRLESRSQ
jgi:GTP-binding protein